MRELIDNINSALDGWADGKGSAEDHLGWLIDVLKDDVEPKQTGMRGKLPNHMLLPLLVWAAISRQQIFDRKISVNAVIEALEDQPLPNGSSYDEKQLERLYQDGLVMVGKLDEWVLLEVQGAIKAADMNETHQRRVKDQVRNQVGRHRKEYEAWRADLSDEERNAEAERVFLNQLREQHALQARDLSVINTCLIGIARCRGLDLTLLSKDEAQKWVNNLLSTI